MEIGLKSALATDPDRILWLCEGRERQTPDEGTAVTC